MIIDVIVGNMIVLQSDQWNETQMAALLSQFTYDNPDYHRVTSMGYWAAREILTYFFSKDKKRLFLPRGGLAKLSKVAVQLGLKPRILDMRTQSQMEKELTNEIALYDYQVDAVKRLIQKSQGLLIAPTGSGKTITMLGVIQQLKQKTLIIVNRTLLLEQWKKEISRYFGIKPKQIGVIAGSNKKLSNITVGMLQTLVNHTDEEWKKINDNVGCVIFDECQHQATEPSMLVGNHFKAKYRYGITAEYHRKDKREFMFFDLISPDLVEIDYSVAKVEIDYVMYDFPDFNYNFNEDWSAMLDAIANNKVRNEFICDKVMEDYNKSRHILIITERINHAKLLGEYLSKKINGVEVLIGNVEKEDREDILKRIKNESSTVLIATRGLIAEGIDIPILDTVHLVSPSRNFPLTKQMVGRVVREYDGKKTAYVRDYNDNNCGLLNSMALSRLKFYKKLKYKK